MAGLNKVMLIGNLGDFPTGREAAGSTVTEFRIAVHKKVKDRERTDWFNIEAWGSLGDICLKYLRKGTLVYIEGELVTGSFTGNDGAKRNTWHIRADKMEMLSAKEDSPRLEPLEDDPDIPF